MLLRFGYFQVKCDSCKEKQNLPIGPKKDEYRYIVQKGWSVKKLPGGYELCLCPRCIKVKCAQVAFDEIEKIKNTAP